MTPSIRAVAARTLLAVHSGRATLAAELDRARREFADDRDRGLLMELCAGTLRWRGALDAMLTRVATRPLGEVHETVLTVLRIGAYELTHLTRVPAHAAINEAVEAARTLRQARAAGFVNAVLRNLQRAGANTGLPARPADDDHEQWLAYLTTTLSHPRWLAARYLARVGPAGAEAWCRYNNTVPGATVRVRASTAAADVPHVADALAAAGATPSARVAGAWRLPPGASAGLPDEITRELSVQDEGSQLVAARVAADAGQRVLDVCAAPGGKSAWLARAVGRQGLVVSCDTRPARLTVLTETLRREGVTPRVVRIDAAMPLPFGAGFDRVLLDAPCSGLGTIARDPDVKWNRDEASLARFAATQRAMIAHAARAVAPGGRLIYATCSSEPEENTAVVDDFLAVHPEFARMDADLETRPDRDGLDAFFAAVLVHRERA